VADTSIPKLKRGRKWTLVNLSAFLLTMVSCVIFYEVSRRHETSRDHLGGVMSQRTPEISAILHDLADLSEEKFGKEESYSTVQPLVERARALLRDADGGEDLTTLPPAPPQMGVISLLPGEDPLADDEGVLRASPGPPPF